MIPFNIFQTAYVVRNIVDGVAIANRRFGMSAMAVNRDVSIETGQGIAICHFALAFVGDVQVEIIQPAGGADAVYRDMLSENDGLRLHHLGVLITDDLDWRDFIADVDETGEATPVRGTFGDMMHYLYLDRRTELGHYVEYMYQTAAGARLFDDVPRYPGLHSPTLATRKPEARP